MFSCPMSFLKLAEVKGDFVQKIPVKLHTLGSGYPSYPTFMAGTPGPFGARLRVNKNLTKLLGICNPSSHNHGSVKNMWMFPK